MLAEAFHSTAGTGIELLLLVGMKRSSRAPDELDPHGHGKALYFYSLLVAVYIFGVRGGLAVHHGITHLRNPERSPRTPVGAVLCSRSRPDLSSIRGSFRIRSSRLKKTRARAPGMKSRQQGSDHLHGFSRRLCRLARSPAGVSWHLAGSPIQQSLFGPHGLHRDWSAPRRGRHISEEGERALLIGKRTNRARIRRGKEDYHRRSLGRESGRSADHATGTQGKCS